MSAAPEPAWVVLDGRVVGREAAAISPLGDGFMFGQGVFTTLRVRAGRPLFFDEHLERLSADAQAVGLSGPPTAAQTRERVVRCHAANGLADGALKIIWFQDLAGCGELIVPRLISPADAVARPGARLLTVRCAPRSGQLRWGHKTLGRLEHFQAKRAALAAGCDDALWVDAAGRLLETATGNIWLVRQGEVHTPRLESGVLPGVVRRILLRRRGVAPIRETDLSLESLAEADEAFMTNSLLGVRPVAAIEGRSFDLASNPVTQAFAAAFGQACDGSGD